MTSDVWPQHMSVGSDGALSFAGVDCRVLAQEYSTPLYVMDEEQVRSTATAYRAAYEAAGASQVFYASKALLTTAVARWVHDSGLGIDVASGGELAVALRAGVPGKDLVLHGNNKSVTELTDAVSVGVGLVVLDSFEEIARLAVVAAKAGVVQPVLVRVTLGVQAHTHEFIATAHEDQKFGFSVAAGDAAEAIRRVVKLGSLSLAGLHSHIGSQIFDAAGFEVAAARMAQFAKTIWDQQGQQIALMNLGGGMGIAYRAEDDPLDVTEMAAQIGQIVAGECAKAGIAMPALAFEPGRAIVGPAGVTLYEVGVVKTVALDEGSRMYVAVDGGLSDNIRPALYGAEYTVTLASRASTAPLALARLVGKHCESGDILVREAWLPADITAGDLVAVAATGAYTRSMASNYNYLPRPAMVSVRDGRATLMLRRETAEDLMRLDPGAEPTPDA